MYGRLRGVPPLIGRGLACPRHLPDMHTHARGRRPADPLPRSLTRSLSRARSFQFNFRLTSAAAGGAECAIAHNDARGFAISAGPKERERERESSTFQIPNQREEEMEVVLGASATTTPEETQWPLACGAFRPFRPQSAAGPKQRVVPLPSPPAAASFAAPEDEAARAALDAALGQEELLKLYVLRLEEEANYFKASTPAEEELCACPKCQVIER